MFCSILIPLAVLGISVAVLHDGADLSACAAHCDRCSLCVWQCVPDRSWTVARCDVTVLTSGARFAQIDVPQVYVALSVRFGMSVISIS